LYERSTATLREGEGWYSSERKTAVGRESAKRHSGITSMEGGRGRARGGKEGGDEGV